VFVPLLSIITDQQTIEDLKGVAREYHRQFVSDKGMAVEGQLLEIIAERRAERRFQTEQQLQDDALSIKDIAHFFAEKYGAEYDHKITPKWTGSIIRRKLHLRTERYEGGYRIARGEEEKIERLIDRYGLRKDKIDKPPDSTDRKPGEGVENRQDELPELNELVGGDKEGGL
jgi:pyruvate-formate lyase-activating enzyme